MKPIFKSSLIKDVVISYVCMIVFPVMIILGMVFLLAGRYIYRAATESVTVTQQAVLELYKEEMRGSALALSRVVNMNGGTTIQDASGYDTQKQEQAMEQLYTMYQMLAAPEYKILDIHIYRKDGTAIIPKGEMLQRGRTPPKGMVPGSAQTAGPGPHLPGGRGLFLPHPFLPGNSGDISLCSQRGYGS